ncbi:MAG TPA: MCP four helix bundle domain-containing protein, partial [Candidatus Sulfotelmatobacter sp.]|nr:MCP four helix bundle domain-containing protein [Candidatus Sulfotelmatobacter sp.]
MKLKIGAKLGLGFGIILALMVVGAVLSYTKLTTIRENAERMTKMRVPTMEAARILADRLDYAGNKSRQTILAGMDPARRAKAQQAFDAGWAVIDKQLAKLEEFAPNWTLQANRDRLAALKAGLPKVRQAQQATMDEAASGGKDAIVKGGND